MTRACSAAATGCLVRRGGDHEFRARAPAFCCARQPRHARRRSLIEALSRRGRDLARRFDGPLTAAAAAMDRAARGSRSDRRQRFASCAAHAVRRRPRAQGRRERALRVRQWQQGVLLFQCSGRVQQLKGVCTQRDASLTS